MRSTSLGGMVSILCLCVVTGCVPLSAYRDLEDDVARLKDIGQAQERKLQQAELELRGIRARDESGRIVESGYREHLAQCQEDNRRLLARALRVERELAELKAAPPPAIDVSVPGVEEEEPGHLVLQGAFFFPSGSAVLRPQAVASLAELADLIRRTYPDRRIYIDGHTDRQPVKHTVEANQDNWLLGAKRAHAVFAFFLRHGFRSPGDRTRFVLRSFGFGREREAGRIESARNRRVEILVGEPLGTREGLEAERRGS